MSFSRGRSRVRVPRRRKGWNIGPGAPNSVENFGGSANAIVGQGAEATQDGGTLVRLRGSLLWGAGEQSAQGEGWIGAFGIGIVTAEAFAIGSTAMPSPVADVDWDGWIYWTPVQAIQTEVAGGNAEGDIRNEESVDTKAMRKLRQGDTIFAAVEVVTLGTASGSFILAFDSRTLIALP